MGQFSLGQLGVSLRFVRPGDSFLLIFRVEAALKKKKKKKAERKKEKKKKKSQGGSDGGDDESEIVYICASNVGLDSIQPSIYRTRMILLLQAGNFSQLKIDCCALKGWRLTE